MNIQVSARQYSNEAEQYAAAKARRARLMGPTKRVNWKKPARPLPAPIVQAETDPQPKAMTVVRRVPLWQSMEIRFDFHVFAYDLHRAANGHPIRSYIRARAEQFGLSYAEVVVRGRRQRSVFPRQLIMWEIKNIVKPDISWLELGRLFGGRDYTTAQHSVHKIDLLKQAGKID